MNELKRAIYVGKETKAGNLRYGMTGGYCWMEGWRLDSMLNFHTFKADGDLYAEIVSKSDIYIPSEDQTRHCPKP